MVLSVKYTTATTTTTTTTTTSTYIYVTRLHSLTPQDTLNRSQEHFLAPPPFPIWLQVPNDRLLRALPPFPFFASSYIMLVSSLMLLLLL